MAAGALMGGGGGGRDQPAEAAPAQPIQQQQQQGYGAPQQQMSPCENELKQFINCAQTQRDLGLCQGFNEALRECRVSYGESVNVGSHMVSLRECRILYDESV